MTSLKNQKHEEYLCQSLDPLENLKNRLLLKYEDKSLEDLGAKPMETSQGEVLTIKNSQKINFKLKSQLKIKKSLTSDFKLLPGIGEVTEKRLKEQGYHNMESLQEHPKFSERASIFLEKLESESCSEMSSLVKKRYPSSHQRVLDCAGFAEKEHFIFLDIETLGLSGQPVILMGEASIENNEIEVRQYILKNLGDEPAVLSGFTDRITENTSFVSFNGVTFDLPYIKNRLRYFRLEYDLDRPHFDLLHYSRRFWRNKLPNCKLTTIERHLFDIERVDDVPGSHIPGYYSTYLKEDNIGPMVPIIEHNRLDIVTLALILAQMHDEI
ncbi:ribonuclease H-like domain-containing protein [Methanobacterium alcaliphilum]|uniref:ribonuclease H-like domain-containing protein n=1 Tax=Methanobacterium alcaliphilum TaxID=392018 RepID=UPI00200A040F|nr:ribonuclease H-like domain-containing protein [Methanobacterium alcaliphilum]MCK9151850.1 ribonuclease H-like domain-containing protein [Methanobacterium alcaliphilum]